MYMLPTLYRSWSFVISPLPPSLRTICPYTAELAVAAVCVGQRPVQREAGAVQGGDRPLLRQHRHGTLRGLAHGTEHHWTSERMGRPASTHPPTIRQSLRHLQR